jgi:hypothetical protein
MAGKDKHRAEYAELRNKYGLMPSEAHRVQLIPDWQNTPWVTEMLNQRRAQFRAATRRGITAKGWETKVIKMYVDKDWLKPGLKGKAIDPYAWVRAHVDKYHRAHPEYTSPWQHKSRSLAREAKALKNSMKKVEQKMRLEGAY